MSIAIYVKISTSCRYLMVSLLSVLLAMMPAVGAAEIIWDGRFPTKTFYPAYNALNQDYVTFFFTPEYGRPVQTFDNKINTNHIGNGDLISLESSPTRGSNYSAKYTIKNSVNGTEPRDCDPTTNCSNRRSQTQMTNQFSNILPYQTERWLSFSAYVPSDFSLNSGGFDLVVWGSKPYGASTSGWLGLKIANDTWEIAHRFSTGIGSDPDAYWQNVYYDKDLPDGSTYLDAIGDFPDPAASQAALGNLNKGGWTDFVIHFKLDASAYESNTGFLDIYMRAGSGSWVHVVNILPKKDFEYAAGWAESMPERIYDRGIGTLAPNGTGSNIGLYCAKKSVWGKSVDTVMYFDNYKVGDENTTFEQMSHDGSSISSAGTVRPMSPTLLSSE